jgi:hypothetical protein
MAARKNEIVRESYYTLILCCFFICEIKKIVTNSKKLFNSYIWHGAQILKEFDNTAGWLSVFCNKLIK